MKETILEDLNFQWEEKDIIRVIRWWEDGRNVIEMADRLNRDEDEVALLIIYLARKDRLKERSIGIGKRRCNSTLRVS